MPGKAKQLKQQAILTGIALWMLIFLFSVLVGSSAERLSPGESLWDYLLPTLEEVLNNPLYFFSYIPKTALGLKYCGGGLLFGGVAFLMCYNRFTEKQDLLPSKENGSAKWNQDYKEYAKKYIEQPLLGSGSPNMILTQDIFLSMNTRLTRRNNNILVIGGTGTGKSRFLIMPNIMQCNCSFVVTDPSGEILKTMGHFLETEGYVIKILNLVDMRYSDQYNPFNYVSTEEDVLSMITALIANTTPKGSHSNDPFWEKAETALLEAVCFYIRAKYSTDNQNFSQVMEMLRMAEAEEGEESELDKTFKVFEKEYPKHIAATSYAVFRSAGGGRTAQSIVISAQTRLQAFNLSSVRRLTSVDTIDLTSVGTTKTALFCITPIADPTFNFLVGLLYTQLFSCLYKFAEKNNTDNTLPVPVRFMLDEFANIGTIPNFHQLLATMRKYQISCTIVVQALSQLKAMYKDDWEVIIGNCDSLLFLGGTDKTTLEYLSTILGKKTIRSVSTSRTYGRQKSYSTNYNRIGRELATPDELRTMPNEDCIFFLRGLDPFYSKKFDPKSHPNYKKTAMAPKGQVYDVTNHKELGNEK